MTKIEETIMEVTWQVACNHGKLKEIPFEQLKELIFKIARGFERQYELADWVEDDYLEKLHDYTDKALLNEVWRTCQEAYHMDGEVFTKSWNSFKGAVSKEIIYQWFLERWPDQRAALDRYFGKHPQYEKAVSHASMAVVVSRPAGVLMADGGGKLGFFPVKAGNAESILGELKETAGVSEASMAWIGSAEARVPHPEVSVQKTDFYMTYTEQGIPAPKKAGLKLVTFDELLGTPADGFTAPVSMFLKDEISHITKAMPVCDIAVKTRYGNSGLSCEDSCTLAGKLNDQGSMYPIELNTYVDETSAMGFITEHAAKALDYEYHSLEHLLKDYVSGDKPIPPGGIFIHKGLAVYLE